MSAQPQFINGAKVTKLVGPEGVLEYVMDKLKRPTEWCQGAPARNADNKIRSIAEKDASSWSIDGALGCAAWHIKNHRADAIELADAFLMQAIMDLSFLKFRDYFRYKTIMHFNDSEDTTHSDVVFAIRSALEALGNH